MYLATLIRCVLSTLSVKTTFVAAMIIRCVPQDLHAIQTVVHALHAVPTQTVLMLLTPYLTQVLALTGGVATLV